MAFKHRISFATDLAENFGFDQLRIMQEIFFKLLRTAISSRCAVRLESGQKLFSRKSRRFRSAALQCLHRIRFGSCGFVHMPYF